VDELKQKATILLGTAQAPESPVPDVVLEPTSVRWTFFRNQGSRSNDAVSGGPDIYGPLPDSLLGVSFAHVVFLDSQGNLSVLPLYLWPEQWSSGSKFKATLSEDLWTRTAPTDVEFKMTTDGFSIYRPSLLGSVQTISFQDKVVEALNLHAEKDLDGNWTQRSPERLLSMVDTYRKSGAGVSHRQKNAFSEGEVSYSMDEKGVESSNRRFSITVVQDHWRIQNDKHEWWLYFGTDKLLLIDVTSGQTALMTKDGTTATVTSSQGNVESIIPVQE
jgi:hypothetical protein